MIIHSDMDVCNADQDEMSPERHLWINVLKTFIEDVDSLFIFKKSSMYIQKHKLKPEFLKAEKIQEISTLNMIRSQVYNDHTRFICDLAGIDYLFFVEKMNNYINVKQKEWGIKL